MTHEELVAALDQIPALRNRGTTRRAYYLKAKPFLHFHQGRADVRFGDDWTAVPLDTDEQRQDLLTAVRAHLGAR